MTKLNCTARNCVNNEGGLCGAGYILVEGIGSSTSEDTFCSNYKDDNIGNQVKALGNTNYVGEIMQMFSSMDDIKINPEIACHATSCFYNGNGRCEARDINMVGENATVSADTNCETFVEK